MKRINSFIYYLLFALLVFSCKTNSTIDLYVDREYEPLLDVTLDEYKSVQLRNPSEQDSSLALGLSIAGGGSRAQYFGTGVLLGLEEIRKDSSSTFLSEIDYISTVSGGGFGVGYYLTIKKNILNRTGVSFNDFYFGRNGKYQDYIYKNANLWTLANRRRYQKGKDPIAERLDYEVLQYDKYNQNNPNKLNSQMSLGDFFIPTEATAVPELPIFVPNATVYANGERFPFMPHIISNLKITKSLKPNEEAIPLDNSNGFNNGYSLPLKYALTASSAFPGALPDVRFQIKDQDDILILIDGGTNENLGYTTLFELLHQDKNSVENKKALIIDCSGEGMINHFMKNDNIALKDLLTTAVFFTVQTKYADKEDLILRTQKYFDIPEENSLTIGFSTIKDYLISIPKDQEYESYKTRFSNTENNNDAWFDLYKEFRRGLFRKYPDSFKEDNEGNKILSSLDSNKFPLLTPSEILLLFEYSSQVDTKLKIFPDEREILTLAGRFLTHIKRNEIENLLSN